jgi:hypothetical protein
MRGYRAVAVIRGFLADTPSQCTRLFERSIEFKAAAFDAMFLSYTLVKFNQEKNEVGTRATQRGVKPLAAGDGCVACTAGLEHQPIARWTWFCLRSALACFVDPGSLRARMSSKDRLVHKAPVLLDGLRILGGQSARNLHFRPESGERRREADHHVVE